jgi:hypothetical protein
MYVSLSERQSIVLARALSLLHALVPVGLGAGLIIWALAWPRHIDRAPAGFGDEAGLFALLFGLGALACASPYAVLAWMIWRGWRWAVVAWACLAGLQGAWQLFLVLSTVAFWGPLGAGAAAYSLLLLASCLPAATAFHRVVRVTTDGPATRVSVVVGRAGPARSGWWYAARMTSMANLIVQAVFGAALIAWSTAPAQHNPGPLGINMGGLPRFIGGVVVLVGCLPHASIVNRIWIYRREALERLSGVATIQALAQALFLASGSRSVHGVGLGHDPLATALTTHTALLVLSVLVAWKAYGASRFDPPTRPASRYGATAGRSGPPAPARAPHERRGCQ